MSSCQKAYYGDDQRQALVQTKLRPTPLVEPRPQVMRWLLSKKPGLSQLHHHWGRRYRRG
jgi:hypothetical protein